VLEERIHLQLEQKLVALTELGKEVIILHNFV